MRETAPGVHTIAHLHGFLESTAAVLTGVPSSSAQQTSRVTSSNQQVLRNYQVKIFIHSFIYSFVLPVQGSLTPRLSAGLFSSFLYRSGSWLCSLTQLTSCPSQQVKDLHVTDRRLRVSLGVGLPCPALRPPCHVPVGSSSERQNQLQGQVEGLLLSCLQSLKC